MALEKIKTVHLKYSLFILICVVISIAVSVAVVFHFKSVKDKEIKKLEELVNETKNSFNKTSDLQSDLKRLTKRLKEKNQQIKNLKIKLEEMQDKMIEAILKTNSTIVLNSTSVPPKNANVTKIVNSNISLNVSSGETCLKNQETIRI